MTQGLLPLNCRLDAELADDPKAAKLVELMWALAPSANVWLTTSRAVGATPAKVLFSARSKLARLGVASATAFQWVAKNERTVDWNRIRTAADLHRIAAERFVTEADERHYLLDQEAAGESARAHLAALRLVAATNSGVAGALVAYEADPVGHWAAVVRLLNHQRLENVREWRAYLTRGNEAYAEDPFWQSCAWGVVHAALTSDRNRGLGSIVPLHKGALADLRQSLETEGQAVSLSRRYERLRAEYARQGTALVPAGGDREWVYIPSKAEAKRRFRENVNRLQSLSCPTWCTKSYNAERYLERGGFWLLLEGGTPIAAIRLDGKAVAEIQGVRNDGRIPPEAAEEIDALLASHRELERADVWRVRNPAATDGRLVALAAGATSEVRLLAARHPNAGARTLNLLAWSEYPELLYAVASHPNTPAATLHRLAHGTDSRVLIAVTQHPHVLVETLVLLGGGFLNGVQAAVALHPATPTDTLVTLASARSKLVRSSVARNPNTPPATLTLLAKDEYYGVRGDAAANPNTPPSVLVQLLEDENAYVRGRVAENPNTPRCSLSVCVGVEAFYNPETDTAVFLLDRIESVQRAAALFFHEHTHRLLTRIGRLSGGRELKRLLDAVAPQLTADLPILLQTSGHKSLADLKRAYRFDESAEGRLALLGELLARQMEQLAGDSSGDKPWSAGVFTYLRSVKIPVPLCCLLQGGLGACDTRC